MEVGDLVWFPCDTEKYEPRMGILIGFHDNPADLGDSVFARNQRARGRPPRQVADILYIG